MPAWVRLGAGAARSRILPPLLLAAWLCGATAPAAAAPLRPSGPLSDAARRLVEEDWQRQDEGRLRQIREPGEARFVQTKLSWPGAGASPAVALRRADAAPARELVAARAGVLSPGQMPTRYDEGLEWRPAHGRARRHRSMRNAMGRSCRLLSPDIQRFFECLSVTP